MTGKERAELALSALVLLVGDGESGFGNDQLWLHAPLDEDQVQEVENNVNRFLMESGIGSFLITEAGSDIVAVTGMKAIEKAQRDGATLYKTARVLKVAPCDVPTKVKSLVAECDKVAEPAPSYRACFPSNKPTVWSPVQQLCGRCGKFVRLVTPYALRTVAYCDKCSEDLR